MPDAPDPADTGPQAPRPGEPRPAAPGPGDGSTRRDPPDPAGRRWFELFNEVGIIAQLARTLLESTQPDGLTQPQFSVLNHLVRLGDGKPPLDIARAFQTPKASMTNTLAGLEARGLIETRPHARDGRSKLVHLTAAGRARREAAIAAVGPQLSRLGALVDPEAVERLLPDLVALRRVLDANRAVRSRAGDPPA